MLRISFGFLFLVLALSNEVVFAQETDANLTIEWKYPGEFSKAMKEAQETKRMILIKGLGFGLDELGAKCSTKGCW